MSVAGHARHAGWWWCNVPLAVLWQHGRHGAEHAAPDSSSSAPNATHTRPQCYSEHKPETAVVQTRHTTRHQGESMHTVVTACSAVVMRMVWTQVLYTSPLCRQRSSSNFMFDSHFSHWESIGAGSFSEVFKVTSSGLLSVHPTQYLLSRQVRHHSQDGQVFAVKKSRRSFSGRGDRCNICIVEIGGWSHVSHATYRLRPFAGSGA